MKPFAYKDDVLTPSLAHAIDTVLANHNGDATQLVGILLEVQETVEHHYIPKDVAYYVAEQLKLKPTQVYDVITFYDALHSTPRAKYTLQVCSSAPCRVNGSETLCETLQRLLNLEVGEVTYDGRFSIETVPCFGACDMAPAVRCNGMVFGNLNSEERILDMLHQLD